MTQGTTVTLDASLSVDPAGDVDEQPAVVTWACVGPGGRPCLNADGTPLVFSGSFATSAAALAAAAAAAGNASSATSNSGIIVGASASSASSPLQDLALLGSPAGMPYEITVTVAKGARATSASTRVTVVSGRATPLVSLAPLTSATAREEPA